MTTSDANSDRGRWAATSLAHDCKERFKQAWHDLPDGAARRWLVAVVVGFALSAALTAGMSLGVKSWTDGTSFAWEADAMRWIGGVFPLSIARWISVLGNSLWLWPVTIFAAAMSAWYKKPLQALSIFPAYAITQLIVSVGWIAWDRIAPQVITEQGPSAVFNSFPSGHTAHAVFAFGILTYLWWRAASRHPEKLAVVLVFLVLAGAVSVGRLASGAHWPTDILAAWVVGLMWLAVQVVALRVAGTRR
ncbi:MAG: phosphatase PAP2 family protein [Persicimonas sp.]